MSAGSSGISFWTDLWWISANFKGFGRLLHKAQRNTSFCFCTMVPCQQCCPSRIPWPSVYSPLQSSSVLVMARASPGPLTSFMVVAYGLERRLFRCCSEVHQQQGHVNAGSSSSIICWPQSCPICLTYRPVAAERLIVVSCSPLMKTFRACITSAQGFRTCVNT